ncbi:hypothetical protein T35B1_12407 [Salinisphaera shabanensis T35B1]|mgnify:FL=1|jgi:membrane-bound inhibitor of C-type lysozyme|uniref:Membrane lipoprotein n=1 Tax=Salinisphaera shabanensis E1L3A TaxID=1033802 RepID=U2FP44_9GAMM|nr:MliC family protein [Salinisphaera shabanensis]ERJ17944.1 membrane lipoprotein [Salinisphaera shabanensis E1L3A]
MFFIPRSATAAGTLLGAALLATGCAGAPETPPQTSSSTPMTPAVQLLTYRCDSGATVRATYPTDTVALVRYQDTTQQLQVVRAASGVRYLNEDLEWWTKGSGEGATAMLSKRADDTVIERCEQVAPNT